MKIKNKFLNIIYLGAILPLLFGSLTFFYWYYNRIWFANNINIELIAIIIIAYILIGIITLIFILFYIFFYSKKWKKILIPFALIIFTIPAISFYSDTYNCFSEKAYVKIVKDVNDINIKRISSDNFEITYFDNCLDKDICKFSYFPVYTYNWEDDSYNYTYDINKVTIELIMNDTIQIFDFPKLYKGECRTVKLSEIIKN